MIGTIQDILNNSAYSIEDFNPDQLSVILENLGHTSEENIYSIVQPNFSAVTMSILFDYVNTNRKELTSRDIMDLRIYSQYPDADEAICQIYLAKSHGLSDHNIEIIANPDCHNRKIIRLLLEKFSKEHSMVIETYEAYIYKISTVPNNLCIKIIVNDFLTGVISYDVFRIFVNSSVELLSNEDAFFAIYNIKETLDYKLTEYIVDNFNELSYIKGIINLTKIFYTDEIIELCEKDTYHILAELANNIILLNESSRKINLTKSDLLEFLKYNIHFNADVLYKIYKYHIDSEYEYSYILDSYDKDPKFINRLIFTADEYKNIIANLSTISGYDTNDCFEFLDVCYTLIDLKYISKEDCIIITEFMHDFDYSPSYDNYILLGNIFSVILYISRNKELYELLKKINKKICLKRTSLVSNLDDYDIYTIALLSIKDNELHEIDALNLIGILKKYNISQRVLDLLLTDKEKYLYVIETLCYTHYLNEDIVNQIFNFDNKSSGYFMYNLKSYLKEAPHISTKDLSDSLFIFFVNDFNEKFDANIIAIHNTENENDTLVYVLNNINSNDSTTYRINSATYMELCPILNEVVDNFEHNYSGLFSKAINELKDIIEKLN